jgi:excisionase family DNA binding protein
MTKFALSPSEFCTAYGISRNLFNRLVSSGALSVLKVGRRIVVPLEDIERWKRNSAVQPEAQ